MAFELKPEEGTYLVRLARRAIVEYLEHGKYLLIPSDVNSKFQQKCGVFVTLNTLVNGTEELRGCIGFPTPEFPLAEATVNAAVSSATQDPRFPPVENSELAKILIEVSVITPPSLIVVKNPRDYPKKVKVGRDGLIVERGWFRGLLLPQVPVEWKWDSEEFLSHCCMKAGLSPDSWLMPNAKIQSFEAIVFSEKTPGGEVKQVQLSSEEKTKA